MPRALVAIKLVPNAARSAIDGWEGSVLKVRVQSPPVDGKANAALIRLLAQASGVSKSRISIIRGETSRQKTIAFESVEPTELRARIDAALR